MSGWRRTPALITTIATTIAGKISPFGKLTGPRSMASPATRSGGSARCAERRVLQRARIEGYEGGRMTRMLYRTASETRHKLVVKSGVGV